MATSEVIVIGGGITGCATAYELSKQGVHVTLLERERIRAMGSGWTLAGVRQSGRLAPELPIAREAIRRWEHLGEELGAELDYRQNGNLRLALSAEQADTIRQVVADGNEAGVAMHWVDGNEARKIAPALVETVVGASFCPTDGHADNAKTVDAYAAAAQRLGTTIVTGAQVEGFTQANGRITGVNTTDGAYSADAVVVAAGIYTPNLLKTLDLELPIQVVMCPVAETFASDTMALSPVLGVAEGNFAARQTAAGGIRFIGESIPWNEGARHTPANTGMTVQQLDNMTRKGLEVLPGLADLRIDRVWGGLIDRTPDVLPVLDAVPEYPGLIVGAGFSGHGFGIGPMSGEILANLVMTESDSRFDLSAFQLGRFAGTSMEHESLEMLG